MLTMAKISGNLAQYRHGLPEFEFDIVLHESIKLQATDALLHHKTKDKDRKPLE